MSIADDLPPRSQVFDYWKDRLSELGFFVDWGEPGCWACGFHYEDKYDIRRPGVAWKVILKHGDQVPLQRCHIVARALGGADDVANLFLMCRECHDLAPNTVFPDVFFDWARAQSFYAREFAKLQSALASFSLDEAGWEGVRDCIASEKFKSWVSGKFGLHRPQSNYAPRSSRLTPATIIGLAVRYRSVHDRYSNNAGVR